MTFIRSVVSYKTSQIPIYSNGVVNAADKLSLYDSIDSDVIQSYLEYSLASMIYYALKEGACSEQSSRMTAMDNSSKNAGNLIFEFTSPIATATEKRKFSLLEEKKIGKKKKNFVKLIYPIF